MTDIATLQAALAGYQFQRAEIAGKMAEIKKQLGGRSSNGDQTAFRKKRGLSAAARKRISAAQKKRWAAFKKAKTATG